MRRSIHIEAKGLEPGAWVIAPRPFNHWGQRFLSFAAQGVTDVAETHAVNSGCRAYLLRTAGPEISLHYEAEFTETSDSQANAPEWVWTAQNNRHTLAADSLVEHTRDIAAGAASQSEILRRIVDDAARLFAYDHPDEKFNDGCDAVPAICGAAKGSCVDINTYILAAARACGLTGQYLAGYWFHPHKTETLDMHCWLAFSIDGELQFWDLAHALKWGGALGARIEPGLNPAGGRRFAMSCGRGLEFETPVGLLSISHFSEPVWLRSDGAQVRPELRICVEEPDGLRTQLPHAIRPAAAAE